MPKNIDVKAHVERYRDTDPNQIDQLIEGLTKLKDQQKLDAIEYHKRQLAILSGEDVADEAPVVEKPKKKKTKGEPIIDAEFEQQ